MCGLLSEKQYHSDTKAGMNVVIMDGLFAVLIHGYALLDSKNSWN